MAENNRHFGRDLADRPRASTEAALATKQFPNQAMDSSGLEVVGVSAGRNGMVAACATAGLSGAVVYAANTFSPFFRRALGTSGKVALVVTPSFGAFALNSHLTIGEATRDPDGFLAARPAEAPKPEAPIRSNLSIFHSTANTVYTHPFKTIMGIAGPIYGGIFYMESVNPATAMMPLSQRLIHTRVYGQMVAVLSTVTVMGFTEQMKAAGGLYRIQGGRLVRGDGARSDLRHWYSHRDEDSRDGARSGSREHDATAGHREQPGAVAAVQGTGGGSRDGLDLLVPLLYAPLLPLMRILGRGRMHPERLNQLMMGTIGVALVHAGSIMFSDSTVVKTKEEVS